MMLKRTFVMLAVVVACTAGCASKTPLSPTPEPSKIGQAAVTPAPVKRLTRIVVSGASGHCTATIDDYRISGKRNKRIAWLVEDASTGCSAGEDWHIRLEFESEWNNGDDRFVKIKRDDIKGLRVNPNTTPTQPDRPLKYKVYLIYPRLFGEDVRIEVIDPELDIQM
jgi:hypothetical protein